MIVGDKYKLQASLTQAVLKIQTRLVKRYTRNLRALSVVGTKIAACAAKAARARSNHNLYFYTEQLLFFQYALGYAAFTLSIFCVCQATIVRVFGPTQALNGGPPEMVMRAVRIMEQEQTLIIKVATTAVMCAMSALCVIGWLRLDHGIAAMDTAIYVCGMSLIIKRGLQTYEMFKWEETEPYFDATISRDSIGSVDTLERPSSMSIRESSLFTRPSSGSFHGVEELVKFATSKVRGELYWREPLIAGGLLRQVYVTLRKGKLEIYKCQADFEEDEDPLNPRPINVWEYEVELNPKIYAHDIIGQTDFCLPIMMSSKLKEAVQKYKFALMPKVFSELTPLDTVELMATDEQSFRLWTNALKKTIQAHEELGGREGVLAVTRNVNDTRKIIKVENALSAANTDHAVAL